MSMKSMKTCPYAKKGRKLLEHIKNGQSYIFYIDLAIHRFMHNSYGQTLFMGLSKFRKHTFHIKISLYHIIRFCSEFDNPQIVDF